LWLGLSEGLGRTWWQPRKCLGLNLVYFLGGEVAGKHDF